MRRGAAPKHAPCHESHGNCLSSYALGILIPSSHDTAPLENGMLIFVRFSFPSSYRNLNIITKRGVLCSFILYVFTATYRPPIILAVISRMPFLVCNDKPLPHRLSSLLVPVEFGTMTLYIFFLSTVFSMLWSHRRFINSTPHFYQLTNISGLCVRLIYEVGISSQCRQL